MSKEQEPKSTLESDFSHLYKYSAKNSSLSQQERRELLLLEQKEKRHNFVDGLRDLTDIIEGTGDENEGEEEEVLEEMDIESSQSRKKNVRFCLTRSEWFTDIPDDLEDNWYVKFAPEGFRILMLAWKNHTVCYNEKGKIVLDLRTNLPGGGLDKCGGSTVLDCILNKRNKTIFVLDCLHWNTMSMLDSEASFRMFWLKNKFDENPAYEKTNLHQKLQCLPFFPAQKPLIQDEMFQIMEIQNKKLLYDGVVFYHKEANYVLGETPLVTWLSSFMLPEKLGIDIPEEYTEKTPKDYDNMENYLKNLEKKKQEKREKRKPHKKQMDMS